MKNEPNKAVERSRLLVTDHAFACSAPSNRLAHHDVRQKRTKNEAMSADKKPIKYGCLQLAGIYLLVSGLILAAALAPFYFAWKDEPLKEADAIALGERLTTERASQLVTQAREIILGKPYSLPPKNSGLMWDEKYGYPKELSDIKPVRIDVISKDEVWFGIYKFFDTEVVIAVVDLATKPKVILRTGLDDKYRFEDRKVIYEE